MSFSIAIRRIPLKLHVLSWSILLNTILFSLKKVLHPVKVSQVTLDINVELSYQSLIKLFSNVWQNHN